MKAEAIVSLAVASIKTARSRNKYPIVNRQFPIVERIEQ